MIDLKNCLIAEIDNYIRPVILVSNYENAKTKAHYYFYRDLLTQSNYIQFHDSVIHEISYYMDDEEIIKFEKNLLHEDEKWNIITRAIKTEENKLYRGITK